MLLRICKHLRAFVNGKLQTAPHMPALKHKRFRHPSRYHICEASFRGIEKLYWLTTVVKINILSKPLAMNTGVVFASSGHRLWMFFCLITCELCSRLSWLPWVGRSNLDDRHMNSKSEQRSLVDLYSIRVDSCAVVSTALNLMRIRIVLTSNGFFLCMQTNSLTI